MKTKSQKINLAQNTKTDISFTLYWDLVSRIRDRQTSDLLYKDPLVLCTNIGKFYDTISVTRGRKDNEPVFCIQSFNSGFYTIKLSKNLNVKPLDTLENDVLEFEIYNHFTNERILAHYYKKIVKGSEIAYKTEKVFKNQGCTKDDEIFNLVHSLVPEAKNISAKKLTEAFEEIINQLRLEYENTYNQEPQYYPWIERNLKAQLSNEQHVQDILNQYKDHRNNEKTQEVFGSLGAIEKLYQLEDGAIVYYYLDASSGEVMRFVTCRYKFENNYVLRTTKFNAQNILFEVEYALPPKKEATLAEVITLKVPYCVIKHSKNQGLEVIKIDSISKESIAKINVLHFPESSISLQELSEMLMPELLQHSLVLSDFCIRISKISDACTLSALHSKIYNQFAHNYYSQDDAFKIIVTDPALQSLQDYHDKHQLEEGAWRCLDKQRYFGNNLSGEKLCDPGEQALNAMNSDQDINITQAPVTQRITLNCPKNMTPTEVMQQFKTEELTDQMSSKLFVDDKREEGSDICPKEDGVFTKQDTNKVFYDQVEQEVINEIINEVIPDALQVVDIFKQKKDHVMAEEVEQDKPSIKNDDKKTERNDNSKNDINVKQNGTFNSPKNLVSTEVIKQFKTEELTDQISPKLSSDDKKEDGVLKKQDAKLQEDKKEDALSVAWLFDIPQEAQVDYSPSSNHDQTVIVDQNESASILMDKAIYVTQVDGLKVLDDKSITYVNLDINQKRAFNKDSQLLEGNLQEVGPLLLKSPPEELITKENYSLNQAIKHSSIEDIKDRHAESNKGISGYSFARISAGELVITAINNDEGKNYKYFIRHYQFGEETKFVLSSLQVIDGDDNHKLLYEADYRVVGKDLVLKYYKFFDPVSYAPINSYYCYTFDYKECYQLFSEYKDNAIDSVHVYYANLEQLKQNSFERYLGVINKNSDHLYDCSKLSVLKNGKNKISSEELYNLMYNGGAGTKSITLVRSIESSASNSLSPLGHHDELKSAININIPGMDIINREEIRSGLGVFKSDTLAPSGLLSCGKEIVSYKDLAQEIAKYRDHPIYPISKVHTLQCSRFDSSENILNITNYDIKNDKIYEYIFDTNTRQVLLSNIFTSTNLSQPLASYCAMNIMQDYRGQELMHKAFYYGGKIYRKYSIEQKDDDSYYISFFYYDNNKQSLQKARIFYYHASEQRTFSLLLADVVKNNDNNKYTMHGSQKILHSLFDNKIDASKVVKSIHDLMERSWLQKEELMKCNNSNALFKQECSIFYDLKSNNKISKLLPDAQVKNYFDHLVPSTSPLKKSAFNLAKSAVNLSQPDERKQVKENDKLKQVSKNKQDLSVLNSSSKANTDKIFKSLFVSIEHKNDSINDEINNAMESDNADKVKWMSKISPQVINTFSQSYKFSVNEDANARLSRDAKPGSSHGQVEILRDDDSKKDLFENEQIDFSIQALKLPLEDQADFAGKGVPLPERVNHLSVKVAQEASKKKSLAAIEEVDSYNTKLTKKISVNASPQVVRQEQEFDVSCHLLRPNESKQIKEDGSLNEEVNDRPSRGKKSGSSHCQEKRRHDGKSQEDFVKKEQIDFGIKRSDSVEEDRADQEGENSNIAPENTHKSLPEFVLVPESTDNVQGSMTFLVIDDSHASVSQDEQSASSHDQEKILSDDEQQDVAAKEQINTEIKSFKLPLENQEDFAGKEVLLPERVNRLSAKVAQEASKKKSLSAIEELENSERIDREIRCDSQQQEAQEEQEEEEVEALNSVNNAPKLMIQVAEREDGSFPQSNNELDDESLESSILDHNFAGLDAGDIESMIKGIGMKAHNGFAVASAPLGANLFGPVAASTATSNNQPNQVSAGLIGVNGKQYAAHHVFTLHNQHIVCKPYQMDDAKFQLLKSSIKFVYAERQVQIVHEIEIDVLDAIANGALEYDKAAPKIFDLVDESFADCSSSAKSLLGAIITEDLGV
jgi:hypothetical protein